MSDNQLHYEVAKFIVKCSLKLSLNDTTLASACVLYHRFYKNCSVEDYDPYTTASTAILVATKVEEQPMRVRDVINVCQQTRHPDRPLLELDSADYWNMRDTIAACELLLMRVLKFEVTYVHPHKYLLHYLMSLSQLFNKRDWLRSAVNDTAWSILKDSFLSNACLEYVPQIHAIATIDLALQCCKLEVPLSKHAEVSWWKALYSPCTYDEIISLQSSIVKTYELTSCH